MQYITLLLSSTPPPPATTSPLKVRVEYSCGSVEYTTACSTVGVTEEGLANPTSFDVPEFDGFVVASGYKKPPTW